MLYKLQMILRLKTGRLFIIIIKTRSQQLMTHKYKIQQNILQFMKAPFINSQNFKTIKINLLTITFSVNFRHSLIEFLIIN